MDFEYSFGRPAASREAHDEPARFRILVLGALSGQGGAALAQRTPLRVDIDNFDAVFARIAPRLSLAIGDQPIEIGFESLDDFHPDRLFERVEHFAALRGLRAELRDPALYRRAAAALGLPTAADKPAPAAPAAADADIERLLGRKPSPTPAPATPVASSIDAILRSAVAPHVVPDTREQQTQLIAAADALIGEHLRQVLHHPEFQALEALWRGVDRLVRELESGGALQVHLMDLSHAELLQDIAAHAEDLSRSLLQRLLSAPAGAEGEGQRWSLLVLDQAFGPDAAEIALLTLLGAFAARAGAPLLAAARPGLLGCASLAQLADARDWLAAEDPALAAWNALRGSSVAPWIGLALPRILQRLPYGAATDPLASLSFEEFAGARRHEHYLWGSAALALALLAGRAFQEEAWEMSLDAQQDLDDLPSHVFREDGEAHQQAGAELLMSESAGQAALARGVMPFLSYRNRNAARLLRWQSIATPQGELAGPWAQ